MVCDKDDDTQALNSTIENVINIIGDEAYRIDAKFLDPEVRDRGLLFKILEIRLKVIAELDRDEYERNLFTIVSSIYAIGINDDNINKVKHGMMGLIEEEYSKILGYDMYDKMRGAISYVIDANIVCGNALEGVKTDCSTSDKESKDKIVVSQWSLNGDMVTRRDYYYEDLSSPLLRGIYIKEYPEIDFKDVTSQGVSNYEEDNDSLFDML